MKGSTYEADDGGWDPAELRDANEQLINAPGFREAVAAWFEDYYAQLEGSPPVDHTVQVTSFGGSGSTALLHHLALAGADVPKTPDSIPFKHHPIPPDPDDVPDGFRVVYVYDHPTAATVSLFRLGHQRSAYALLRYTEEPPPPEYERALRSLRDYAELGEDVLGLGDHLSSWIEHPHGYPVMFLTFTSLFDTWPTVRSFLGLGDGLPCIPYVERRGLPRDVDPALLERLHGCYAPLLERMSHLPPVFIVP